MACDHQGFMVTLRALVKAPAALPATQNQRMCSSVSYGPLDPVGDCCRGFVKRERDRPFEAPWLNDEYRNAVPERVRSDPAFKRLSDVRSAGLDGRRNALPPGSGNSLTVEDGY